MPGVRLTEAPSFSCFSCLFRSGGRTAWSRQFMPSSCRRQRPLWFAYRTVTPDMMGRKASRLNPPIRKDSYTNEPSVLFTTVPSIPNHPSKIPPSVPINAQPVRSANQTHASPSIIHQATFTSQPRPTRPPRSSQFNLHLSPIQSPKPNSNPPKHTQASETNNKCEVQIVFAAKTV